MAKISKSDQDVNANHDAAEALAKFLSVKSQHFEVGTFIVVNQKRGEIKFRTGPVLTVRWDDGSVSNVKPIALDR